MMERNKKYLDPWKVQKLYENLLDNVQELKNGWFTARCPFHNDQHNSFSFNPEIGYAQCFSCGWRGNLKKFLLDLGYEEKKVKEILKKLFTDEPLDLKRPTKTAVKREVKKSEKKKEKLPPPWKVYQKKRTFIYRLPDGTPVMKKYRYEEPKEEFKDKVNRKTFIVKWLTERKSIFYGMETLPRMKSHPEKRYKVILWAEGEKCAEELKKRTRGIGVLSFQNVETEWKNSLPYIHPYIRGEVVHFIFVDNDEVGRAKAMWLAEKLYHIGVKAIYLIDFGDERKPKWDIADELMEGKSLKETIKKFKKKFEPQKVS
jgi:hypothetical protein